MSLEPLTIGPFAQFYIGDAGLSTPLQPILLLNTDDNVLTDRTPTQWFQGLNKLLQVGPREVQVSNLKFYSDNILLYNLCMGLSVSNTTKRTQPGNTQQHYSLFGIYPDDTEQSSFYIPDCWTARDLSRVYSKTKATDIAVSLTVIDSNPFKDIVYYDSIADLVAVMGSRAPVGI